MKFRNFFTIFFAIIAIFALLGLTGYMTLYVADDSNFLRQQLIKVLGPVLHIEDDSPVPVVETSQESTETVTAAEHSFIFVGDSRTIGMRDAVNDSCVYLGAEGEGYPWFADEGVSSLDEELKKNPDRDVIINFGVNDPENVSLYIDLYHSLISQYPDTSFYFLSVNPLVDDKGFNTTNEMISLFNATVASAFPNAFLDSNTYLQENGFETVDGLHYTDQTYRMIHDFVVARLS